MSDTPRTRELNAALAENQEQARLLGISGSREAKLLAEIESLKKENARIKANHGCARNQGTTQFCAEVLAAQKELDKWKSLLVWGGDPEIINQFMKAQQDRIYECQNIEKTCADLEKQRDQWHALYREESDKRAKMEAQRDELRRHADALAIELSYFEMEFDGEAERVLAAYRASQQPKQP